MTKIKICGITNLNDALASAEAGADLLGFNFYPKSPRYITPEACRAITSTLRQKYPQLTLVGVFVNASSPEIHTILQTCNLHLAQLHGDESPDMLTKLNGLAFKAIRLSSDTPDTSLYPFLSVENNPFIRSPSADNIRSSDPHPLTTPAHPIPSADNIRSSDPHPLTTPAHPIPSADNIRSSDPHPLPTPAHPLPSADNIRSSDPYPLTTSAHPLPSADNIRSSDPYPLPTPAHPLPSADNIRSSAPHPLTTSAHPLPSADNIRSSAPHPLTTSVHPLPSADNIRSSDPHPLTTPAHNPVILIDASIPGLYGGSGQTADWTKAAELAKQIPILLAGGLTPENVAAAIAQVQPWGVDVASGVESQPGKKDPAKIKEFITAVLRQTP